MNVDDLFQREVDVAISVIVAVLVIISIGINGFALRIIIRILRPDEFVNPTLNIVFNTSLSDLLYTLFPMIATAVTLAARRSMGQGVAADIMCNIIGPIFNVTVRQVVISILGLSIVRLIAITKALHFKRLMQGPHIRLWIVAMWILPVLESIVPFIRGVKYQYSPFLALCTWDVHEIVPDGRLIVWAHIALVCLPLFLPGLMIIILYITLLVFMSRLKNKQAKIFKVNLKVETESIQFTEGSKSNLNSFISPRRSESDLKHKWLQQATWTTLFVVTAFLICYLPYWSICFEFLLLYIKHYYYEQMFPNTFSFLFIRGIAPQDFFYLIMGSHIMMLLNASINPLVFIITTLKKQRAQKDSEVVKNEYRACGARYLSTKGVLLLDSGHLTSGNS